MAQEDKNILLKDICARVPYGIIASVRGSDEEFQHFHILGVKDDKVWVKNDMLQVDGFEDVEVVKPYLRSPSSMTAKETIEWHETTLGQRWITFDNVERCVDWLLDHHFDFRGLIEKGLALEAPKGMYKTK